jgi:hypothetical protein
VSGGGGLVDGGAIEAPDADGDPGSVAGATVAGGALAGSGS